MNDDDTPSARYIVAVFALATLIVLLAVLLVAKDAIHGVVP